MEANRRVGRGLRGLGLLLTLAALAPGGETPRQPTRVLLPSPPTAATAENIRLQWTQRTMGHIGRAVAIADIDADGEREIVVAGHIGRWYTLQKHGSEYRQTWVSEPFAGVPSVLAVANVDADGSPEVVIVAGAALLVYDGVTRALQQTIPLASDWISDMVVADVDGDGNAEALVCVGGGSGGLYVYELLTGGLEYQRTNWEVWDVAVGNVDADPGLEIVLAGWGGGWVLDGATRVDEWAPGTGFGARISLVDINRDGIAEIVASSGSLVRIFDANTRTITGSFTDPYPSYFDPFAVFDFDGDGALEIAVQGYSGLRLYHAASLTFKGTVPLPEGWEYERLLVGDTDDDGAPELMLTGRFLYLADPVTGAVRWQSSNVLGPFTSFSTGDVNADGRPDLVSATGVGLEYFTGGSVFGQDAATGALNSSLVVPDRNGDAGHVEVVAANVDGDAQEEVCFGSRPWPNPVVSCHDGLTLVEEWRIQLERDEAIGALVMADVDLDGSLELVIGVAGVSYSQLDHRIMVLDARTGALEWRSPTFGRPYFGSLRVANIDPDPAPEIVVGGELVVVLDTVARTTSPLSAIQATAMDTADLDGDGISEILVARSNGDIVVVNPFSGAITATLGNWGGPIYAFVAKDIDGAPGLEYVVVRGNRILISGPNGCAIWDSGVLGTNVGEGDTLMVEDIDADGLLEIVVNIGSSGFNVYEITALSGAPCCGTSKTIIRNGGFEVYPKTDWSVQTSTNFTTPICNHTGVCGGTYGGAAVPASGISWARFGRSTAPESARLGQTSVLPVADSLTLRFQMRIGEVSAPFTDALSVAIDGTPLETFNEPSLAEPAYSLREIDLTPFADGAAHALLFSYEGPTTGVGTFNVDDVDLSFCSTRDAPSLSIDDVVVLEGPSGTKNADFTVRLRSASATTVSVVARTSNRTASAATDYTATGPLTLTFAPGVLAQTFSVPVKGDQVLEADETFVVTLTNPVNAVIFDAVGTGSILNDELPSRTFVSRLGTDASDCSLRSTPCRNIARALSQTAPDGEVIIIGPGDYETSPLLIDRGIKITAPAGVVALIRQPIVVDAPGSRVALRGLTIKGVAAGGGITLLSADVLSLEDTTIDRWGTGLALMNSAASRVVIAGSVFQSSTLGVDSSGAHAGTRVMIEGSRFEGNATGLAISAGSFVVRESAFALHSLDAIVVGPGSAEVRKSTFSSNTTALRSLSGGDLRISGSHVFGNGLGLGADPGSNVLSSGTNVIRGNATNTSGLISLVPEQ